MQKPSIPKGTRDFGPVEMTRRNYLFDTIKEVFRAYGYAPLETPAMENLSTLMGKYGEEGDKLLFKILNSGEYLDALEAKTRGLNDVELKQLRDLSDSVLLESINSIKQYIYSHNVKSVKDIKDAYNKVFLNNIELQNLGKFIFSLSNGRKKTINKLRDYTEKLTPTKLKGYIKLAIRQSRYSSLKFTSKITPRISEKGLRYDLTVPLARYVVQHQGEVVFPFRRYQIQPVWRADRPQKGRYREFYQCDVDVIGSRSLLSECELVKIVEAVFSRLGINVTLKMNNRKILFGIAETIGHADKMIDITVAIDKLDKIGMENVEAELSERGIGAEAIAKLKPILELDGSNERKLSILKSLIKDSETGLKGIEEMETIFSYIGSAGTNLDIEIDLSLARGLNYYTGAIFEVKAKDFAIGSICGGGRYDDLTGIFGMPDTSGVGISFGADRIYDVMLGLNLFPEEANITTRVMFVNFGSREEVAVLHLVQELRDAGVPTEIYPDAAKMKKQMDYANKKDIPYVVIIGESELASGEATVKDMRSGEQTTVAFDGLVKTFNSWF